MEDFANFVVPGIYLGDIGSLKSLAKCEEEEQKDWVVVSLLEERESKDVTFPEYVEERILLNVPDDPDYNILEYAHAVYKFIDESLEKDKTILIHCAAGISRSPTVLAYYLMVSRGINVGDALDIIRLARPTIGPNYGFRTQLESVCIKLSITN
jgi:protein-tyrosine phosphatase